MAKHVIKNVVPQVVDESGGNYDLQLFLDTYNRYLELSRYLFASKEPIYDINEMPVDHKFYAAATEIAKQIGVDWATMSHADSNRIMLALLEDAYNAMGNVGNKKKLVVEVKLKIVK